MLELAWKTMFISGRAGSRPVMPSLSNMRAGSSTTWAEPWLRRRPHAACLVWLRRRKFTRMPHTDEHPAYSNVVLLIDGEWREAAAGERIPVLNPGTEKQLGWVSLARAIDL